MPAVGGQGLVRVRESLKTYERQWPQDAAAGGNVLRKTCTVSFVFLRSQMRHLVPWILTLAVPIVLFAVTYGLRAPVSPESGAEAAMFFESYVVVTGILNNLILRWAQIRESGVLVQVSYMCGHGASRCSPPYLPALLKPRQVALSSRYFAALPVIAPGLMRCC